MIKKIISLLILILYVTACSTKDIDTLIKPPHYQKYLLNQQK